VTWTIGQRSKDTFQYIGIQKSFFSRGQYLIGQSDAAHWIITQSPTDKTTYEFVHTCCLSVSFLTRRFQESMILKTKKTNGNLHQILE